MFNKLRPTIGFDADDTLWQNEHFFRKMQHGFINLLADYAMPNHLESRLLEAEKRNIGKYGFGIKGFTLSMIETAIEVTDQKVPAQIIKQIIDIGQEMLRYPIHIYEGVLEVIKHLSERFNLILITRGDLLDQESKLARSKLGEHFDKVEIVSDKNSFVYKNILNKYEIPSHRFLMVGNAMKSDILPVLEIGGWAVHIPNESDWVLEAAARPENDPRFHEISKMFELLPIIDQWEKLP